MIKKFNKYVNDENTILRLAEQQNIPYDRITELDCYNEQLTSLKGVEKLVNLKSLDCCDNLLTSLEGIENLVNLKHLRCFRNKLTSLKGIENLVDLVTLNCSYNQLIDIDLEGIEDLYNIGIDGMGLFDNLKNLKYLNIVNNKLSEKYKDYLKKKFKNIHLYL